MASIAFISDSIYSRSGPYSQSLSHITEESSTDQKCIVLWLYVQP